MPPGLTDKGRARLHESLAAHVERGAMPGLVALVARGGDVHVEVIGTKAFTDPEPLGRDAIFRIASLSKPIGAVGAMVLVEDGTFALDDAVDAWLPELADRRVLRSIDAELDDTVPADRPITVADVLTFTLGFGNIMAAPGTHPIQRAEAALQLTTLGPPWPPTPIGPDEWIARFGSLPLMHQPGEQWMYNTGAFVLGVLLERAAGQSLESFLRARVFDPLGMVDTGFSVPPEQLHRLTTAYAPHPDTDGVDVLDGVEDSWWSRSPALPNVAGWLVSTIDDYWAFAQMLRNGGELGGQRVLSEEGVRQLTTDRLTPAQRAASALFFGDDDGWGLGMVVPRTGVAEPGPGGGYGWDGGTGTTWRTNRARDLTGILFTQRCMTSPAPPAVFLDFWAAADAAVDVPT